MLKNKVRSQSAGAILSPRFPFPFPPRLYIHTMPIYTDMPYYSPSPSSFSSSSSANTGLGWLIRQAVKVSGGVQKCHHHVNTNKQTAIPIRLPQVCLRKRTSHTPAVHCGSSSPTFAYLRRASRGCVGVVVRPVARQDLRQTKRAWESHAKV